MEMVTLERMSIWYLRSGANYGGFGGTIFDSSWLLLVVVILCYNYQPADCLTHSANVFHTLGAFLEDRLPCCKQILKYYNF